MNSKTQYLIQILEKIGSPLMQAVISNVPAVNADGQDNLEDTAKTVAELLSRTVQVSIDMSKTFDFAGQADIDDGDSIRVALAALAGPLVAEQYRKNARMPGEQELRRLTSTLDSVLTFSENFTPSGEAAERLKALQSKGGDMPKDLAQMSIQYIAAFAPVIDAIARFSFGQSEKKLVLDVTNRLIQTAIEMRESVFSHIAGEDAQKAAEITILTALSQIYAACHDQEVKRLSADVGVAPDGDPMAPLWAGFDVRCQMVQAVMIELSPANAAPAAMSAPAPVSEPVTPPSEPEQQAAPPPPPVSEPEVNQPEAAQDAPAKPSIFSAPKTDAPAEAPPVETESAQNSAPQAGNPMSMFAKPKDDAPAAAPSSESPPEQPPPEAPPATPPESQESGESDGAGDDKGGDDKGSEGDPMSFFKSK